MLEQELQQLGSQHSICQILIEDVMSSDWASLHIACFLMIGELLQDTGNSPSDQFFFIWEIIKNISYGVNLVVDQFVHNYEETMAIKMSKSDPFSTYNPVDFLPPKSNYYN